MLCTVPAAQIDFRVQEPATYLSDAIVERCLEVPHLAACLAA